jgi:CarboxypepD_reg-like domain
MKKKHLILLLFCFTYLFSVAQISGQVLDSDGLPISYATIFNLKNKMGSISDSIGHFRLDASISDSIRIQHISYKSNSFKISNDLDKYHLQRNINDLKEIIVSKNYAAWLYFKGYFNTVSKMKNESRTRMYGRAAKLFNADTLEKVSMDLDYKRNNSGNNPNKFSHNRFIEVQRYREQFNARLDTFSNKLINFRFFPAKGLPGFKEASSKEKAMNDYYIFQISVDSSFFKLDFIPRKIAPPNSPIYEVIIAKKDTCMISFAVASWPSPLNANLKDKVHKPEMIDNASFYRIEFKNGQGEISETYSVFNMYYSNSQKINCMRYSIHMKKYTHHSEIIKNRLGSWMINNSFIFNRKLKSKYSDQFWKNSDFPKEVPYDFDHLRSLKLKNEQQ